MLKTIIIDDEPAAREKLVFLLENYCANDIQISAVCKSGEEGLKAISELKPDLIFLDVEMPFITGFDLLRQLTDINFDIVFTTAHDHYAIKAIKFSALDYLLKPIDLEQLKDAVKKAVAKKTEDKTDTRYRHFIGNTEGKEKLTSISVPTANGYLMIKINEIVWCGAVNYFCVINLVNKQEIVTTRTLKELDELLFDSGFLRIHRSHTINLSHIVRYIKGSGGQVEMTTGAHLDVARRSKDELINRMQAI